MNIGCLVIWRVAEITAPFSDLEALADQTGFDRTCLPTPPVAYDAWQKATNLRRQRLIAPAALVADCQEIYGCQPVVEAESKIINRTVRMIYRTVTISQAREKNEQLNALPVAVLRFDETGLSDKEKFVSEYAHDDPLEAINGNVDCLIHRMRLAYQRQLVTGDGSDIRCGIRAYLGELGAVCLADGTYFVPETPAVMSKLMALQGYIAGLEKWRQSESVVTCQVYPVVVDSPFIESNRLEIVEAATRHFTGLLETILANCDLDNRGLEATKKRLTRLRDDLKRIEAVLAAYRQSLGDLPGVAELMEACREAMATLGAKLK